MNRLAILYTREVLYTCLEEAQCGDGVAFVKREAVVDAWREDEQVLGCNVDTNPSVC